MSSEKKSGKKLYNRDNAHILTDIMIAFIGICILMLAFLSLVGAVPEEYAFGATLAGLFFVFSDILIIEEKITIQTVILYGITLFFGLASFILLPVILFMDNGLKEILMSDTDFITFLALGLVLILIGYKTLLRKIRQQEEDSENIKELKVEFLKLAERHNESSELIERIKTDLEKAQLQYEEIARDNK